MDTQNTKRSFVHNSMKGMMLVILGASLWGVMGIFVRELLPQDIAAMTLLFCDVCWQELDFFFLKLLHSQKF